MNSTLHGVTKEKMKSREELMDTALDIAEKALEFYANHKNWRRELSVDAAIRIEESDLENIAGYSSFTGGKHAREALAAIKKEIGK